MAIQGVFSMTDTQAHARRGGAARFRSTHASDRHALPVLRPAVRHGAEPGRYRRLDGVGARLSDQQGRAVPRGLDRVADGLGRIRAAHGPNALGVFGGGGLTNEKSYALGKFARVALGAGNPYPT